VDTLTRPRKATGVDDRDEAAQEVEIEHSGTICNSTFQYCII
jgi:hypothetical protein